MYFNVFSQFLEQKILFHTNIDKKIQIKQFVKCSVEKITCNSINQKAQ